MGFGTLAKYQKEETKKCRNKVSIIIILEIIIMILMILLKNNNLNLIIIIILCGVFLYHISHQVMYCPNIIKISLYSILMNIILAILIALMGG